jgi:hypothetical protein
LLTEALQEGEGVGIAAHLHCPRPLRRNPPTPPFSAIARHVAYALGVLNHKQRALHPRLHCADATGLLPTYSPDAYQSHPALTSSGSSDGKRAAREPLSRLPRLSPPPALPPSLAAAVPSPSEPGVAASLFPPFSFLSLGGRAKTVARNGTRQSTSSLARLSTPSRSRCRAMAGQGE